MMGVLTCGCLNVSVHYKGSVWKEKSLSSSHIFPEDTVDPLMNQPLYEIELDVAGIVVEHKVLVLTRTLGDWAVHTCSNCSTHVYVVHRVKEQSRVFVTSQLQTGGDGLRTSDDYSHVFKIVLKGDLETAELDGFRRKRVSSMTFGKEDHAFNKIHSQMKDFLNHEQVSMEERVRRYEDDQRSVFAELQERAHRDRSLLFAAISHATERTNSSLEHPSPPVTSSITSSVPLRSSPTKKQVTLVAAPQHFSPVLLSESPLEPPMEASAEDNRNVTVMEDNRNVTVMEDNRNVTVMEDNRNVTVMEDTHDFFMLEEYNNEEDRSGPEERPGPETSAFLQSSDEETSTDDSSYRYDSTLSSNMRVIASSLPVNMLTIRRRIQDDILNTGDQFDPQEVGASIRALALSVQDTGMFGDLPKPRIDCRPYAR